MPEASRPDYETYKISGKLKILIFFSVVYFICVVDESYSDEKGLKFLKDLKKELASLYKGNL